MTALTWDSDPVSDGLERVVLFPPSAQGIPWDGCTSVTPGESGDSTTLYFDGTPYLVASSSSSYSLSLEAYTYPEAFEQCETYPHAIFGLSYRETTNKGYLLHLIWGATAVATTKTWSSRNNDAEIAPFTWDISTKTEYVEGLSPVSHFMVDSTTAPPEAVEALELALYGEASYLPTPTDVLQLFRDNPWVKITDLGDGTFTIEGPEELVRQIDGTTWDIESGGITFVDEETYDIKTW